MTIKKGVNIVLIYLKPKMIYQFIKFILISPKCTTVIEDKKNIHDMIIIVF